MLNTYKRRKIPVMVRIGKAHLHFWRRLVFQTVLFKTMENLSKKKIVR